MTGDEENMLGDLSDLVATHLPLMFMDIGSVSITQPACSTERALHSTAGHSPRLLTTSTHYDSYDDIMHRKTVHEHDYLGEQPQSAFFQPGQRNRRQAPSDGACAVDRTSSDSQLWPLFTLRPDGDLNEITSTLLALCSFRSEDLRLCTSCFTPRYHNLELGCIAEGCNERTTFTIQEEGGRRYHDERLAVWAQRPRNWLNPMPYR